MLVCAGSNGPLLDAKHSDLIAAADAFQAVLVVLSFVVESRWSAQVYNVYNADIGASILGTKASDLVFEEGHLEERSEEHTSELQSLLRISYAVFCLKQKYN